MRIRGLLLVNVLVGGIIALISPQFGSLANLVVLVDNLALEAIALVPMTLLLIGGLFDLSLDGVVALCGVIAGVAMLSGVDPFFAIILGLGVGGLFGLVNGYCVNRLNLNPFMVTLATWWLAIGITLGITRAVAPFGYPEWFQFLGQARVLGLRIFVFYALAVVVAFSLMLHFTVWGRHIYAIGGDRRAAVLCGVRAVRLGTGLYVISGLLAGFIGVVMAARLNASSPLAVDGMALRVIAAAVIGGCSLAGGRGTIVGGFFGLVLMDVLSNASILLHVSPYWQKALIGGILLAAILSEQIKKRRSV